MLVAHCTACPLGHAASGPPGASIPWDIFEELRQVGTLAQQQKPLTPQHLSEEEESSPDILILDTAPLLDCLKHWGYIWAAYANYLKGNLGGDDNGKYLAVMCDAALWIIQLVSCEVSQADGLSWVVLGIFRKNSKTYVNSDDLYCI